MAAAPASAFVVDGVSGLPALSARGAASLQWLHDAGGGGQSSGCGDEGECGASAAEVITARALGCDTLVHIPYGPRVAICISPCAQVRVLPSLGRGAL